MSSTASPEGDELRGPVLCALYAATRPMSCDQVVDLVGTASYAQVRHVLSNLTQGTLVAWTPRHEGVPELFELTSVGREATELLRDPQARALRDELVARADRLGVSAARRELYINICADYLGGMPVTQLMERYGNYDRIKAARAALCIRARGLPGNASLSI